MIWRNRLLVLYALLAVLSLWLLTRLQFTFDFEQFFPQGDPDYEFFKKFTEEFETDDNFLLVAVERRAGVFDSAFLADFHDLTLHAAELPHVTDATSLTKIEYPLKTPFGITTVPAIHLDDPGFYAIDRTRVLADRRFVHNLIAEDATALTLALKTIGHSSLGQSRELMAALETLLARYRFDDVHILGRAYFQREMVWMEQREILVSGLVAGMLTIAVLFFIFRRWRTVFIAVTGIALTLLFFLALLSALGRPLNALSALYPILMCIVGVADTIHLTSKYLDELEKGHLPRHAMRVTVREIGLATFITCITTAIGFASLLTNRTAPIQDFGVNAAVGVVVAFITIYGWLWAMLPRYRADQLIKITPEYTIWNRFMEWTYAFTRRRARAIGWTAVALLAVCALGIARIHTNYRIINNLPRGQRITTDFLYFERTFAGFRPLEVAVFAQPPYRADDPAVLQAMDRVESQLRGFAPIKTTTSLNDVYRSLHAMEHGNRAEAYRLPDSVADFDRYRRLASRLPRAETAVLVSRDGQKTRITARVQDIGRDSIEPFLQRLQRGWAADSSVARFKLTGTGVIFDKNSAYIRNNMLQGLIPSVLIVALIMAWLFRDLRLVLIFTIPNVLPLFFAGALLGYLGIPLEAGIATVFSIVFGIATDDSVHMLSTFQLCRRRGMGVEDALHTTLRETGKAMCLSSIILFFSFLVLLFSIHPASVNVGLLVSITLAGALFCDLLLTPVLLRWMARREG